MSLFTALGISVFAGLLVLIFVGIGRILWWWFLENLYLKVACRHVSDISERWIADYHDPQGHVCHDEMDLKQYGHKITGRLNYTIKYKDTGQEKHKAFEVAGILRNDLLSAYYWNIDRRQKGSGTFTLRISREGNYLKGKYSWFDVEEDEIDVGDYELRRPGCPPTASAEESSPERPGRQALAPD